MTSPLPVPRAAPALTASRVAFYSHLWFGVLFTVVLIVIAVTAILLNHKRALGLMPETDNPTVAALAQSLSIDSLARIALAHPASAVEAAGAEPTRDAGATIDRMDVRPRDGYVKVRLLDRASTELTLDLATGRVLHSGARGDVFLERLHSGEAFGSAWVLLSDAGAIALLITLVSGYWLWLAPRWRGRAR